MLSEVLKSDYLADIIAATTTAIPLGIVGDDGSWLEF
jgi:hypothetical protein